MAWGSTQEAAALFSVMHLFPSSQLEEVGLCWVDPKTQIPPEWGISMEDLPPLGASPDGLIRHRGSGQLPEPALPLHNESATQTSATQGSAAHDSATHSSAAQSSANGISSTHKRAVLSGHAGDAAAASNDASLAEFETLLAKLQISSAQAAEATEDQLALQRQQAAASRAAAPPFTAHATTHSNLAAAKTALSAQAAPFRPMTTAQQSSRHGMMSPSPSAAASTSSLATAQAAAPSVMSAQPAAADSFSASVTSALAEADMASPPQQGEYEAGEWLEAVEIKNVCPFREARDLNGNGKQKRMFRVSDPGPYMRVCLVLSIFVDLSPNLLQHSSSAVLCIYAAPDN